MIIRVFRAQVHPGMQQQFKKKVQQLSIPLVQRQKGLVAYYSGEPTETAPGEFVMVTIWRNLEDLKAFAGENWNRSVIPDEELPLLSETFVHHYRVIGSSVAPEKTVRRFSVF